MNVGVGSHKTGKVKYERELKDGEYTRPDWLAMEPDKFLEEQKKKVDATMVKSEKTTKKDIPDTGFKVRKFVNPKPNRKPRKPAYDGFSLGRKCSDCGIKICDKNKSGRCRSCAWKHIAEGRLLGTSIRVKYNCKKNLVTVTLDPKDVHNLKRFSLKQMVNKAKAQARRGGKGGR